MNFPPSAMPLPRPPDEYAANSARAVNLRTWIAHGITFKALGASYGLTEDQAGYILTIRDALIGEEITYASRIDLEGQCD